jgi:transketolase C-terminal domain/subunit
VGLWIAAVFKWTGVSERNLVEWAAGISTEGAQEMQKGSTQYSVLSTKLWEERWADIYSEWSGFSLRFVAFARLGRSERPRPSRCGAEFV